MLGTRLAPTCRAILSIMLVLLAGCAPVRFANPIIEVSPAESGHVVMAIGSDRNYSYQSTAWIIRSVADDRHGALIWPTPGVELKFGAKHDYLFDEKWGEVASLALPPGKYELVSFQLERGRGTAFFIRWTPRKRFAIPFSVEQGKVTYLGEMLTRSVRVSSFPARSEPRVFELTNQFERDMVYARKKYPALQSLPVTIAVPDVSRLGIPYITNRPIDVESAPAIEMGPPSQPEKPATQTSAGRNHG